MSDRSNEVDFTYFWTAGYDSPMKFWNRRNEVAFEVVKTEAKEINNDAI